MLYLNIIYIKINGCGKYRIMMPIILVEIKMVLSKHVFSLSDKIPDNQSSTKNASDICIMINTDW